MSSPAPTITLDEISQYIDLKGPLEERATALSYFFIRFGEVLFRYPRDERIPRSMPSISSRIDEILPKDGKVLLSGANLKVIVFDEKSRNYREAALDVATRQPVPTDTIFDVEPYHPVGSVQNLPSYSHEHGSFFGHGSQVAVLLERILQLNASVVEIGKPEDMHYPVKLYSK